MTSCLRPFTAFMRFVREAWDGKACDYTELQQTRLQIEQQREYTSYLVRTAPAVRERIEQRWAREHARRRWLECQAQAQARRNAPIPIKRAAGA